MSTLIIPSADKNMGGIFRKLFVFSKVEHMHICSLDVYKNVHKSIYHHSLTINKRNDHSGID